MPIKAKLKIIPELGNLELTDVHSSGLVEDQFHYHDQLAFAIVRRGTGFFKFKGSKCPAGPGAVVQIAPGEIHTSGIPNNLDGLTYQVFYVDTTTVRKIFEREETDFVDDIRFSQHISRDPTFFSSFLRSYERLAGPLERLQKESIFTDLILQLFERSVVHRIATFDPEATPGYVKVLTEFLHDCFQLDISLDQLSKLAQRSPSQVIRAFKGHMGMTPHSFLLNIRIARAKELLANNTPIAEVAFRVGFHDQSHFHRHFKKITSLTPGDFLRSA